MTDTLTVQSSSNNDPFLSLPKVEFVQDVDAFMSHSENDGNVQLVLKRLEDTYSKLKLMEANNLTTKKRLKAQLTEFEDSLKMLKELKFRKDSGQSMTTQFRMADHVFAMANVPPTDKIGLWLGANVMLEYSLEEAEKLLTEKQEKAQKNLETTNLLIDTLRESVTTLEVNMARIFNWDVKRRQEEKEKAMGKKPS